MNAGYMRFMREIKGLARKRSFAIVGNEPFFKNEAMLALIRAIRKQGDLDEERYDASDRKVKKGTVDDALCEYPLIGQHRLVTLLNADKIKDIERLSYWFDDPTEDTKAIFVFSEELKKHKPPERLVFEVVAVCNAVGVESKEFAKYLAFCLEGTDKQLSADGVEYAKKVFSNNIHIMKNELVKAALYVGQRPEITAADLSVTLASYPIAKVFDMVDALVMRDTRTSMLILEDLLEQGVSGLFITYLLTQRLNTLMGVLRAYRRGERLKEYMIRKKIPLFQFGQMVQGTRVLKEFHIKKFFDILCEFEYRLKRRQGDQDLQRSISESMVVALCC